MDVFVAALVVAAISFVSGGFAIPIGYALGLSPLEVYLAACAGSMTGLVAFLFAGDRVRTRLMRDRDPRPTGDDSGLKRLADRFGPRGLGVVGPIFPGVTASVVIGLSLGFERAAIARWMSIGIAAMFAAYTFGLWVLIEWIGVE